MRAVLLSLLLANALYWVWTRSSSPDQAVAVASIDPDLPSIELIEREVSPAVLAAEAANAVAVDVVALPPGGTDDVVDVDAVNDENSDEQASSAVELVAAGAGQADPDGAEGDVSSTASSTLGVVANTAGDSKPATTQSSTSSLADSPPQSPDNTTDSVNVTEIGNLLAAVDPVRFPQRCISIGPFNSLKLATETGGRLRAEGLETTQRIEQAQVWVGHWVYLPSYPSRAEAKVAVEKLRKAGVNDIYIEPAGELANTVSLGLFSDLERAEVRAGQIRQLDVRPEIQDRHRDGLVYYVDFSLSAGRRVNMGQIQNQVGPEAVKARRIECVAEGVAEIS